MLMFTDEAKSQVWDAFTLASNAGPYGEKFAASLHKQLSLLNLRSDNIICTYGRSESQINNEEHKFDFDSEFMLKWINNNGESYMYGALVWHNESQYFSIHT